MLTGIDPSVRLNTSSFGSCQILRQSSNPVPPDLNGSDASVREHDNWLFVAIRVRRVSVQILCRSIHKVAIVAKA
jgi:hypothetical protein